MMICSEAGAVSDPTAKMAGDWRQRRWAAGKKAVKAAIHGGARVATSFEPAGKRMQPGSMTDPARQETIHHVREGTRI